METLTLEQKTIESKWWRIALSLSVLTIVYNIVEGLVSVYFGSEGEALTLFGFGIDSFIETISATGIYIMIRRIRLHGSDQRSSFEKSALKITGWGFYALTITLLIGAALSFINQHNPVTTLPGIIISAISIISMWALIYIKKKTGKILQSDAIIADANCNLVCLYMSVILLFSSLLYTSTGIGWFDGLGAIGLAWFSFSEGKEAFEKAKGKECSCHS
ncbi:MAG: cation transporter [Calditrichaeota bacterium]|nr:cation transporter [Calditrichota bacterium]